MAAGSKFQSHLDDLRLVLAFSTRLPISHAKEGSGDFSRSLALAPIAGILVACLASIVFFGASALGLPSLAVALLALLAAFWFTGGLHEDGLADFADGLGAEASRLRRLEIMRDSRLGTFGAAAIAMTFLLRASALASIAEPMHAALALIASAALSRAFFPITMLLLAPARPDGLAASLSKPTLGAVALALLLGGLVAFASVGMGMAFAGLLVAFLTAVLIFAVAQMKLGGYTGDVLGALQQCLEIVLLLTFAAGGFL